MEILQILNSVIIVVGIPSIIVFFVTIGRSMQKLDTIAHDIDQNIKPDLKEVREKFFTMEGRIMNLLKG